MMTDAKENGMNSARQRIGSKGAAPRPKIPKCDYSDELSPEAFEKLKKLVKDFNGPDHKRTRVNGDNLFPND